MKTSIPKLHSIKYKSGAFADSVLVVSSFYEGKPLPAINVLEAAAMEMLEDVSIVGTTRDGMEYIATTHHQIAHAAYDFGRGQLAMLRHGDPDE